MIKNNNIGDSRMWYRSCPVCNKQLSYTTKGSLNRSERINSRCLKCTNDKKFYTHEEFISKCVDIHGEKYNYSNTLYHRWDTKVEIYCNSCKGIFSQTPNCHLMGQGCPHCKAIKFGNARRNSHNEFIKIAKSVHGDLYSYDKTIYTKSTDNIIVTCKSHGDFNIVANNHTSQGQGCYECGQIRGASLRKYDSDKFIKIAKAIHGNKYNYTNTNYIDCGTHVDIICNKCNRSFAQKPATHLTGCGCSTCHKNISKPERLFLNVVGIPELRDARQVVIGKMRIDGYDKVTNTVYEFLGDYWHGNPHKYKTERMNVSCKKTFGELYNKTIEKFKKLKSLGYTVKYIWENDWNEYIKGNKEFKVETYE